MIAVDFYKNKAVGVFGLARSGMSAARALHAGGARVFAWDDNPASRGKAPEGATLEPWEGWPWQDLKAVIVSPGIPLTHPAPHPLVSRAAEAGVEVIGDIDLFAHAIGQIQTSQGSVPIIAVTGTNGKSTTTALIGHILLQTGYDAQIGGNIGKPALELAPPNAKTIYVLEVSSYQIDLSPRLWPSIAVLSNISPDHIDRHGTIGNYARVKAALLQRAAEGGHVVVGTDDPHSAAIYTKLVARSGVDTVAVSVGKVLSRGVFVIEGRLYDAWRHPAEEIGDLKDAAHLPGAHNWQNAALAYAAVRNLVRDPKVILSAIFRFPGLAHRMEDVGRIGKVRFVNDSKATNADAAAHALACYDDIYWIAGGKPKEGGITSLAPFFPRLRRAYLIGEAAGQFAATLNGKVEFRSCQTMDRALKAAAADAAASAAADPVVLLSPACASFDQFRDFEQRGDMFRAAVRQMTTSAPEPQATPA